MNILITGGAGFIGRTLHEKLHGIAKVTLLDIKDAFPINSNNVTYVQSDICEQEELLSLFRQEKYDGIIHLAAVSRVIEAELNPEECKRANVEGVHSLLNAIEGSGQKPWLIFGSSREVYGEASKLPVKEDAERMAINIYGKTKMRGEDLFTQFTKKHCLSCAIVRFSNVYGNRYDIFDRVIPRFIRSIFSEETLSIEGGEQIIDFTHIDDTVECVERITSLLNQHGKIQEDFNVCPGIGWSLYELIDCIERYTGKEAKIQINPERRYDVVRFIGDNEKIKKYFRMLEFRPLSEGIKACIGEYCHACPELQEVL